MTHLETAQKYMKARMAEEIETVLSLLADDFVLESERDGRIEGKTAFEAYVKKNKPTGKWEDPVEDGDKVVIRGKVSFMMIPFSVVSNFEFNSDGKITKIEIKRG